LVRPEGKTSEIDSDPFPHKPCAEVPRLDRLRPGWTAAALATRAGSALTKPDTAMKSYEVCQCGAPLELREQATPEPTGSEVLLRVLAAGVCHSDIHFWEGVYDLGGGKQLKLTDRGMTLPLTMGHETVGEVVAFGPEVNRLKTGDRRLVFPWIGCGECKVCQRGEEQLCLKPRFLGVFRPGGYSDYIMVPHPRYLLDIGDMPAEQAAPLACSGVTAYGALRKVGGALQTEPLLIIGAGGLGLMCLAILKSLGGHGAIVLDIDAAKREAAKEAGALAVIDANAPDVVKQVQDAAGGGVWAAVDFVGAGSTVRVGIDCLTKGGKLIVVGLFGGEVTIPTLYIPAKAMTLQGSYTGSLAELAELLDLVRHVPLPLIPVQRRPLDEAYAALTDLKEGKVIGRVVLAPPD
jgi:propanol-preferring alcohol dehydrogenase